MNRIPRQDLKARPLLGLATIGSLSLAAPYLGPATCLLVIGLAGLFAMTMIVLVVWPAVWSGDKARRDAALSVLDRILWY